MTEHQPSNSNQTAGAEPERQCIVSRKSFPQSKLLRFVVAPDNRVVLDVEARLPGRGAWVDVSEKRVQEAIKKRAFARAFKEVSALQVPDDLPQQVEQMLLQRCLNRLGLMKRSGALVTGFDMLSHALTKKQVQLVLVASDASENARKKLEALLLPYVACYDFLTRNMLSAALGKENLVHIGVKSGIVSRNLLKDLARYGRYKGLVDEAAQESAID